MGYDELVINEEVLLPDYMPERLPGREREITEMAHNFKLALNGRKPENMLIYGPPGTGKTAVLKYVMGQLADYSAKVKIVYVNCWHMGTRFGILGEVARNVGYISPMKGAAVEDVLSRMAEIIKKKNIFVVVVLDEMDRLVAQGHGDVLYDISRMNEAYGVKISVVGIVNEVGLLATLDPRIRSSVIDKDVEFRAYGVPALKEILMERAKRAFRAYDPDAVGLCAAHAFKLNGDARMGISLLLSAGRIAEKKGLQKLDVKSAEEAAAQKSYYTKIEKVEVELGEAEKRIIALLKKGEMNSGDLYKKLKDMNERTVRNYLNKLEESGIIEMAESVGKGRSRIIRLKNNNGKK
jgi:cell division control protein 6